MLQRSRPEVDEDRLSNLEPVVGAHPGVFDVHRRLVALMALARRPEDVAAARIRASDESVDPSEIEKMIVAQVLLIPYLAEERETSSSPTGAAR
jgi:hypothetical protein